MKRTAQVIYALLLLIMANFTVSAQNQSGPFAKDVPILYLGIDFTQVKVINDASATPSDIKNRYFAGINLVVISEVKKYDWQKALDKSNYSIDLGIVTARNEKIDETKISSNNTADETRLKPGDIENLLQQYDFSGKKGIGLVLFMESLSKSSENGTMWVTFVNMDTQKMILTEKMTGKAMGFGFRNYYAYTVYKVIQDIKKNKLSEWRSKYGS
ncbi:hypothetical protein [Flavihumibacter profundi]|jgi:hypothetical protein|uniref:hypothetical protein n=1 Tax=Flavihumibacter profundi TaxID=2716883 RepID=UPI001CC5C36F|nr:hypothetical protein [Flavihumibacter profundi]MBZ5858864.1 hypothetical protein [Flavihumibacter profundi]